MNGWKRIKEMNYFITKYNSKINYDVLILLKVKAILHQSLLQSPYQTLDPSQCVGY